MQILTYLWNLELYLCMCVSVNVEEFIPDINIEKQSINLVTLDMIIKT